MCSLAWRSIPVLWELARGLTTYHPSAENYRAMVLAHGHPSTTRAIGNIVSGLVPVFVGGRRIDVIPFTHEGVEIARTPDDNRAAMNVHEAAAGARGGDQGGTSARWRES